MMHAAPTLTRDLVLIGGGHSHALVLRMWGMRPLAGARLTLIDPAPVAAYSGMLPGHVAGHYSRDEMEIDLVRLARFAGARLILGAAEGIDPAAGLVHVAGRAPVAYDVASVDVGVHSRMPDLPGFSEHGHAAKPLDAFAARWAAFRESVARGVDAPEAAVIGGGLAGIELAMAMAHALHRDAGRAEVSLIEAGPVIAPDNPAARPALSAALARNGIRVVTGQAVARVGAESAELADGTRIATRFTTGAAGARAHGWLAETGLPVTGDGFLRTGPDLRIEGQEALFAAGDCAHLTHAPRPKAGVFAVRAAPVLRDNLRAALTGGRMRRFRPQKSYLKLVSLGRKSALAEKWGMAPSGPVLWRWKDRIDRKFMRKLNTLPQMKQPDPPRVAALGAEATDQPLCGACGSKVAPGALAAALAGMPAEARGDVLAGPGDDAAILETGGAMQVLTTDHLRAFTEDPWLMTRIAALHALGDIWAMGAAPQAALLQLVLPRMSAELQARTMAEIMVAARGALGPAGAAIVGGHSTMGAEMTVGFTVTGLLDGNAVTQAGARPGDALILTRPLGSGTLLAAEMQGRARGRDIAALLAVMQTPQGDAAALLRRAHAMTDVTGFGLAGHLLAICRASGVAAVVNPASLPLFDGAEALAETGLRSTIWSANRAAAPVAGAEGARGALLHDPQTAGGFLAAVPREAAAGLVDALRAAGHDAALIGRIEAGPPALRTGAAEV